MNLNNRKKWANWISELNSIAQNGLSYSKDPFDLQRYTQLQKLCAIISEDKCLTKKEKILELFSLDIGYATPKIDVRGALFKQGCILLVRESSDGLWTLPGGWADINYSPSEAIEKEILEETGYKARAVKLIAIYDKSKHEHPVQLPHTYKCFFLCHIEGVEGRHDLEISEIGFFAQDSLPPLSIKRVTPKQIERCFAHYKEVDLPAEFD